MNLRVNLFGQRFPPLLLFRGMRQFSLIRFGDPSPVGPAIQTRASLPERKAMTQPQKCDYVAAFGIATPANKTAVIHVDV